MTIRAKRYQNSAALPYFYAPPLLNLLNLLNPLNPLNLPNPLTP